MLGKHIVAKIIASIGIAGVAILSSFALVSLANAQTSSQPQFLITWRALNSYAPPAYPGKTLPNQTSPIAASFEVIANGRPLDLSGQTIYWYLDDNLLGGGVGVQNFTFRPDGEAPDTVTLRIEVPDYPGGLLIHEISIPIVQPSAVIEASYPQGNFSASPIVAQALPYFFTTTSTDPLNFSWTVNGQAVSSAENPQSLQVSLPQSTPAGFALAINLTVQNSSDSTSATANANLTYSPKP